MTRSAAPSDATNEIRVLSAAAMGEIVRDLGGAFERATAAKVSAQFTRSPLVRDRIAAGESFDIAITTQARIEELDRANKVIGETARVAARSLIGVAVRAGAPKPDIGSLDAFVRALRDAKSIACADPSFGTASGLYLRHLFDRLGLTAELRPKMRFVGTTGGEPVVVCAALIDGRAELALQQIAEIVPVRGVSLVGPLPAEIQHVTAFGIAVTSVAQNPRLARDFVSLFTSPEASDVIASHGMEAAAIGTLSSA